jgi:hypothetical protein
MLQLANLHCNRIPPIRNPWVWCLDFLSQMANEYKHIRVSVKTMMEGTPRLSGHPALSIKKPKCTETGKHNLFHQCLIGPIIRHANQKIPNWCKIMNDFYVWLLVYCTHSWTLSCWPWVDFSTLQNTKSCITREIPTLEISVNNKK